MQKLVWEFAGCNHLQIHVDIHFSQRRGICKVSFRQWLCYLQQQISLCESVCWAIPHTVVSIIKKSSTRDIASVYCALLKPKPCTLKRPLQSLTNICTMKARPNFSHLWCNWGALHTIVRDSDSTSHCAGERLLGFLTASLRDIPPLLKLSNSEKTVLTPSHKPLAKTHQWHRLHRLCDRPLPEAISHAPLHSINQVI